MTIEESYRNIAAEEARKVFSALSSGSMPILMTRPKFKELTGIEDNRTLTRWAEWGLINIVGTGKNAAITTLHDTEHFKSLKFARES